MSLLRLIPVLFSDLLLAAHFSWADNFHMIVLCLIAPALLLVTRP